MTEKTLAEAVSPIKPAHKFVLATKYGWAVPILLGILLLVAVFASLCIGAYPVPLCAFHDFGAAPASGLSMALTVLHGT